MRRSCNQYRIWCWRVGREDAAREVDECQCRSMNDDMMGMQSIQNLVLASRQEDAAREVIKCQCRSMMSDDMMEMNDVDGRT